MIYAAAMLDIQRLFKMDGYMKLKTWTLEVKEGGRGKRKCIPVLIY